jgi:hypothetical protein
MVLIILKDNKLICIGKELKMAASSSHVTASAKLSPEDELQALVLMLAKDKNHPIWSLPELELDGVISAHGQLIIDRYKSKNYSGAYYRLGYAYRELTKDRGLAEDLNEDLNSEQAVESQKWMMRAAELGQYHAEFFVGVYFVIGKGCKKDLLCGVRWLEKSLKSYIDAGKNNDIQDVLLRLESILKGGSATPDDDRGKVNAAKILYDYCFKLKNFKDFGEFLVLLRIYKNLYTFYDAVFDYDNKEKVLKIVRKHISNLRSEEIPKDNALLDFFRLQKAALAPPSEVKDQMAMARMHFEKDEKNVNLDSLAVLYPIPENKLKQALLDDNIVALYKKATLLELDKPKEACCFYLKIYILTLHSHHSNGLERSLSAAMLDMLRKRIKNYFSHLMQTGGAEEKVVAKWALRIISSLILEELLRKNLEFNTDGLVYSLIRYDEYPDKRAIWEKYRDRMERSYNILSTKKIEKNCEDIRLPSSLIEGMQARVVSYMTENNEVKGEEGTQQELEKVVFAIKQLFHYRLVNRDSSSMPLWIMRHSYWWLMCTLHFKMEPNDALMIEITKTYLQRLVTDNIAACKDKFVSAITHLLKAKTDSLQAECAYRIFKELAQLAGPGYLFFGWAVIACARTSKPSTKQVTEAINYCEKMFEYIKSLSPDDFWPVVFCLKSLGNHVLHLNDDTLKAEFIRVFEMVNMGNKYNEEIAKYKKKALEVKEEKAEIKATVTSGLVVNAVSATITVAAQSGVVAPSAPLVASIFPTLSSAPVSPVTAPISLRESESVSQLTSALTSSTASSSISQSVPAAILPSAPLVQSYFEPVQELPAQVQVIAGSGVMGETDSHSFNSDENISYPRPPSEAPPPPFDVELLSNISIPPESALSLYPVAFVSSASVSSSEEGQVSPIVESKILVASASPLLAKELFASYKAEKDKDRKDFLYLQLLYFVFVHQNAEAYLCLVRITENPYIRDFLVNEVLDFISRVESRVSNRAVEEKQSAAAHVRRLAEDGNVDALHVMSARCQDADLKEYAFHHLVREAWQKQTPRASERLIELEYGEVQKGHDRFKHMRFFKQVRAVLMQEKELLLPVSGAKLFVS